MISTVENSLEVKLSTPAGDACLSVKMGDHERKTIYLGKQYDEIFIAEAFIRIGHSLREAAIDQARKSCEP